MPDWFEQNAPKQKDWFEQNAPAQARGGIAPPEATGPIAAKALPLGLQPDNPNKGLEERIHEGSFPGPMMVAKGVGDLFTRALPAAANKQPVKAANEAFSSAARIAPAFMGPVVPAAIAAPVATAGAVGAGYLGSKAGEAIAGPKMLNLSPEAQELAGNVGGLAGGAAGAKLAPKLVNMLPSTARAGQNFQQVMQGARNIPINTATEIEPIVQRATTLSQRGANAPKIVGDLNKALQTGPINYEAGRDFASNAGRLSVMDRMSTSPTMKAQVKLLAGALDTANREAAVSAGLGPQYDAAMAEYRHAKQLGNVGKIVGGAAALYAAKQLVPHAAIQTAKALATAP